jgi:peptide/nickel transport system permease protein
VSFPIFRFIAKRVFFGFVTLFVISLLIFSVTKLLPSDPAKIALGRDATPEAVADMHKTFGLDKPLATQYGRWLGGVFTGDFGRSYIDRRSISGFIGEPVAASFFLLLCAAVISIPLSIAIGSYAALKRDKRFDSGSSFALLVLAAMPEFVVGTLLIFAFSTIVFKLLPATTYLRPGDPPWSDIKGIILPILTLVLAVTPYVARVTRASMIEVLDSDYVEMARLKGMSERTVVWRHALPNAVGPVFQVIALNLAYLAGGVFVVERVFNFPGMGSMLREAVAVRNLPVIQFLALVIAGVYVITNLLADVGTVLVTPRLRTSLR